MNNLEKSSGIRRGVLTTWIVVSGFCVAISLAVALVQGELLGKQDHQQSSPKQSREGVRGIAESLRKLNGNEVEVLDFILSDPKWQEERPGDAEIIQMLAAASIRRNDPEKVSFLLSSIQDSADQPVWKRMAVLEGLDEALEDAPRRVLSPESLTDLIQSSNPEIRAHASLIRDRLRGNEVSSVDREPDQPLTEEEQQRFELGAREFKVICAGCHLESGRGMAEFAPPLVNSTWVVGPPKFLAMIVLQGKEGSPGYPPMPPLRGLDDDRIAAILTYIRREWGHHASPVSPSLVTEVRKATEGRAQAWRERELEKLLEEGSDR